MHVSAEGDLEPCPFAPYSDANLRETPLLAALQSPFLKAVRDNEDHLEESQGACALYGSGTVCATVRSRNVTVSAGSPIATSCTCRSNCRSLRSC